MTDPESSSASRGVNDRASFRRVRKIILIVVVGVAVFLAASWLLTPREVPLPAGATALRLQTQRPPLIPITLGCPLALLAPVTVSHDAGAMVFLLEGTNAPVKIGWPSGWSARLFGGKAELVKPDAAIFAREGDLIRNQLVGWSADDGSFMVCSTDPIRHDPTIPSEKPPDPI